jgi:hypothetical protein
VLSNWGETYVGAVECAGSGSSVVAEGGGAGTGRRPGVSRAVIHQKAVYPAETVGLVEIVACEADAAGSSRFRGGRVGV